MSGFLISHTGHLSFFGHFFGIPKKRIEKITRKDKKNLVIGDAHPLQPSPPNFANTLITDLAKKKLDFPLILIFHPPHSYAHLSSTKKFQRSSSSFLTSLEAIPHLLYLLP